MLKLILKIAFIFALTSNFGCQNIGLQPTTMHKKNQENKNRNISSQEDFNTQADVDQVDPQNEITFNNLMNEQTDQAKVERFQKFLKRNLNVFIISEELLINFDHQLNQLHNKSNLTEADILSFNEYRFKMNIAWILHERKMHQFTDLYEILLNEANDDRSNYYQPSIKLLNNLNDWLKDTTNSQNKILLASLHTLSLELESVSYDAKLKNSKNMILDLNSFSTLNKKTILEARKQVLQQISTREKNEIDAFIEKKWSAHKANILQNIEDEYTAYDLSVNDFKNRLPNAADNLEPDSGPLGHVSGNRFSKGSWAITYDDGPHPTHTQAIYKNLQATSTKATFFWLSQNISKYQAIVKQAGDLGFSRASHSFSHANLPTLSQKGLNREINEALDVFQNVIGKPATLFRCPYGACGKSGSTIRQMIAKRNALEVIWNVDTLDWQDKNPDTIFDRAKKQVNMLGRGIVLFHDIHSQSVIASDKLIRYMKTQKGTQIKLLTELITESRGKEYLSP